MWTARHRARLPAKFTMPARGRRQEHGGTTMTRSPWIAAVLVAALLSMGPLAPLMTLAEAQQMQPPPQPMQVQPPQPPVMGPAEPPVTSQVPGQEAVPVNPAQSLLPPATDQAISPPETLPGDAAAAGVMNVVYIPGKAII